ncbi:hypothetical protein IUY40_18740, partial [Flavobacterium sp. ALJ2]|uniref:beta strand repeat-containing protein n=1 Tax=Flavobacterium sp. ALJ2 TaxID=2786960 RepID=UPI00189FC6C0
MKQKLLIYLFVLFFSVAGFAQTGPGGVTDGLRIWLRPEVGITTSGGNVTNWGDQSGIAIPNDFDQKNASVQPTIAAAEAKFNFHPAVNFNGSNFMRSKVATEAPFDANITDGALYVVDNRTTSGKRLVFGLGDAPIGVDPGANANKPAIGEDSRLGSLFQEDNMSYIGNSYYNYKIGESFIHGVSWWTDKYAKKWCKLDQSGYWELQARDENEAIHSAKGAVLGSQQDQPYDGYIQEVIAYQKRLSDEEMLRIDSYLMIKYGIVTSKDLKYINFIVDSGSNKIWSSALANSNIGSSRYVFSQAGIGRDDLSALNQKQSRSVNEKENLGFNITMGLTTIAPTNAGNLAAFEADRSFMFWADNNRGGGFNIWMPADSGPANKRHEKTWQIQETGTVGTVKFAIPYSERPYKRFFLVRSTDEIFDKSDEYIPLKKFTSGTTTYWACDVDFNDKDYFTLAVDTNPESIALRFTPTVATIAEGRSQIVTVGFPSDITLDTDTVAKFSITGTAINGTDYTTIANTVTIPAGQNSVAINIQALSDSVLELDETVILKGTSVTSASGATWTSSAANATTITITDSSLPSDKILRFSPAKVVVSEGNTTMLKVSLPEGITTTEKIGFSFTLSGTATVNRDYDGLIRTGRGEIPAGKNFIEIGLRALTDSVIELDETAIVTGGGDITSRLTGFSWDYAANEATVVITDASNPANKVLDFSTNAVSVKEGFSSNIYVRVPNLSTGVTTMGYPLVVNYTLSGTATNGIDYTTLSGSVTIEEGASSAEIKVATLTDNLIEPDETVIITGDPLTGFTWGSNNVATVTIKDATDVVNRILRFSPITANVTEGDSTTIQLSLPEGFTVASSVDINYSIAGSATNDADYTALTGIATIPAGSGTTEITIAAKNDNLLEADETILIKGVTTAGFLWSNLENSATVTIKDANPASDKVLRFSSTTEKIAEGSSTRLKVSLPEGITTTSDIRFYYAVGGTATSGKDYTRLTGTGTILAGNNSVDIVVAALTDAVIEGDETVIVTGGGIVGDSLTGFTWDATAKEAIVTITDVTDPAKKVLNFSPTKADVTEGLSTSIKVSLPTGVTLEESLTVNYTIAGTATSDTDYKKLTGSVTIEAGSGFAMIEVASLSDAIIESDETVIITGYDTAGFTWGSANVATVTIIDVTNPVNKVLSISPLTASVAEGEKTTLTVSLPEGITVGTPVDIKYDVYGLAINGTDYALLTGTATIPAGSGTAKIEVTALRDAIIEYDETVFIVGAATAGFIWSPTANTATVTIKDSTAKVLRFSPTTENVAEGSSTTITVSLPEGITAVEHIYFDYTIGGTARGGNVLGGDDYMSLMNINEYISAGNNSVDIVVETLTDLVIELDETVILTGGDITTDSDITGFTWDNAAKEATVTITDVTDPVDKVLYFSPTTAAVAEGRSTDIKVSLPEGVTLGYPLTVNYTISGTATSDTDYTALTGSVTIPVRSRSATIRVAALPDNLIEPDETVIITGGTVPGFTWGSDNEVTITIKDDIAKKVLSMTPYLANVAEGESTTIEINLPERVIVTSPVDIKYQVSGSAINGTDYALLTGTATIPAGSGTAKIEVTALRDAIIEYDEYIYIQGAPTAGFTWNRAANSATATIIDTNPSSDKVLRFSQTTKKIAEGSSTTLTVSLPEGITAQSVIYFDYTLGGTATSSGGSSGNDYRWLNGSGMILNGDNSVDIVVEALTDFVIELDETVIVTGGDIRTYTDMTGFTWDPTANSATVTITDVTDVANTVLNFSPTTANVAEGGNTGISLDLPTGVTLGYPLTVNYTVSGTATSGSDYTALTGSVTIPAGSGTTEIMIAAKNDNLIEPDETVVITGAITAGFTWGSDNVATITIKDATGNDPAKKVLSFSPITTNVAEGESTILMVSLPEGIAVASPTDIKYEIAVSSTAINGADYDTLTGTATIPAGSGTAEITIATKNDNLLEANETIIITGVATAGFTWNRAANSATVTITDSNPASDKKLSFSQTTEKIAEGSSTTLKVSLPQGITATSGITFNYAVGGTATSGDDYTALTGTGTIAAGNNFAAIVIDAKTDTVIEGEETVILTGGA